MRSLLLLSKPEVYRARRERNERGPSRFVEWVRVTGWCWLEQGPAAILFPPFRAVSKEEESRFSVCDPSRSSSWIDFAITCHEKRGTSCRFQAFQAAAVRGKLWHEALEGNRRNRPADLEWSWRGSWLAFSRAIVRSTSDGWRWWRQLLWFIVPGFTSIYSLDLYICVYFVPGVIDLSIHTGMRFCIGINVKVLCIYKYRFRFVVGWIECNDVTETGESRSVSILFHLT